MKTKKYHTVETIPISNGKIVDRENVVKKRTNNHSSYNIKMLSLLLSFFHIQVNTTLIS
jgi:hypothetical protein